jgi:methionine synthase / methylenetetrahydrofolate reductase(NADPH)
VDVMQDFVQTLADSHIYLFDGAMGTMLYNRGVFINRCYDELNLLQPETVLEVHTEYVRAGAEILETNTYGANVGKLRGFGLEDQLHEINVAGARLARKAASDSVFVAGAIGPLGIRIEPYGPTGRDEAREMIKKQARALLEGGVDVFLLETFSNLSEIEEGIHAIREICSLPVIAQMTVGNDGRTLFGDVPRSIARKLEAAGADVIGLNCSVGPDIMLDAIDELASATSKRISCMPNAGQPREIQGRQMYMASPEYVGKYAKRLIHKGVKFIGGCCGTTPSPHQDDGRQRPAALAAAPVRGGRASTLAKEEKGVEPKPIETRSSWGSEDRARRVRDDRSRSCRPKGRIPRRCWNR